MDWKNMWTAFFGRTDFLGLNMGFWIAMAAVVLIVVAMNIVFWSMKPKRKISVETDLCEIDIR